MTRHPWLLALALGVAAVAGTAQAADGAKIFQLQCKTCHGAKSSPMAPSLAGVAGRKIAGLSDFAYSTGLKGKDGTWTDANLDAYLASPSKFAPGTRMTAGVVSAPDRTAVIGYLKTLK